MEDISLSFFCCEVTEVTLATMPSVDKVIVGKFKCQSTFIFVVHKKKIIKTNKKKNKIKNIPIGRFIIIKIKQITNMRSEL